MAAKNREQNPRQYADPNVDSLADTSPTGFLFTFHRLSDVTWRGGERAAVVRTAGVCHVLLIKPGIVASNEIIRNNSAFATFAAYDIPRAIWPVSHGG